MSFLISGPGRSRKKSEIQQVWFGSATTKKEHISECNGFVDAHSKVW